MVTAKPTVHLNGTSRETLAANYLAAIDAVRAAYAALKETHPHGRDYYPQTNPYVLQRAVQEYTNRLDKLAHVRDELVELLRHVQEAK